MELREFDRQFALNYNHPLAKSIGVRQINEVEGERVWSVVVTKGGG